MKTILLPDMGIGRNYEAVYRIHYGKIRPAVPENTEAGRLKRRRRNIQENGRSLILKCRTAARKNEMPLFAESSKSEKDLLFFFCGVSIG